MSMAGGTELALLNAGRRPGECGPVCRPGRTVMSLVMEGIALDDPLRTVIAQKVTALTRRHGLRATASRVAFTDENGPKGGVDIRCAVTIDVPGRPATHANAVAENARLAFDGAIAALERETARERERRRDLARRPKKYFVAHEGLRAEGEAALPPPRRRRRSG
jgi:ribosome-associated translation inhibitor RaiA